MSTRTRTHAKPPFSGAALAAAVLAIGGFWLAGTLFVFGGAQTPTETSEAVLYAFALVGFAPAGVLASRYAGGLAFRELLLATLIVAVAALGFGQFGVTLNPLRQPDLSRELDITRIMMSSPGSAYIGPSWFLAVLALAGFGFLQALTIASLAFMFRSRRRYEPWFGFEAFVGGRYLAAKRRDAKVSLTAAIAALGVCFGVAALIAVISAMSGYQAEVKDKILGTNAHIIVQRMGRDFDDYDEVAEKLKQIPGVVATTPFVFTGGMLKVDDVDEVKIEDTEVMATARGMYPVLVKGIDPDRAGAVTGIRAQLKEVDLAVLRPPKPGELPKIVVGRELMKKLGLKIGSEISLISPVPAEAKRGAPPKSMRFKLAGEFASGMNEFDQKLIYLGIEAAQAFIGSEKSVTGLETKIADPELVGEISQKVQLKLGGWPYRTIDFRQMNSGIFSALKMQKFLMVLMLVFIVIVAAFNIASTLFMLVVEKTREVAVLKALGARDGVIMKIFVIEGHLIGAIGVAAGVVLGLVFCFILSRLRIHIAADVYLVDTLRVMVNPLEIVLIVLGALEVAHLATLYPALRAARTYPVDAMRFG
ncbi:MAG: ABC transporter permease [Deltaproteobacteria bacterium]|nr:ABC transporter permease [Deltaproteobacteria bacterium]